MKIKDVVGYTGELIFDITKLGFAAAAFGAILAAILWLILKFGEGSVLAIVDASGGSGGAKRILPKLQVLALQSNRLSGPVPSFGEKLCPRLKILQSRTEYRSDASAEMISQGAPDEPPARRCARPSPVRSDRMWSLPISPPSADIV